MSTHLDRGQREQLPPRRSHTSWRFVIENITYVVGYGLETFPDSSVTDRVTELWCNAGKVGSSLEALANDAAILASLCLQYGCPIEVMRGALTRNSSRIAAGPIGVLLDTIAREMGE